MRPSGCKKRSLAGAEERFGFCWSNRALARSFTPTRPAFIELDYSDCIFRKHSKLILIQIIITSVFMMYSIALLI